MLPGMLARPCSHGCWTRGPSSVCSCCPRDDEEGHLPPDGDRDERDDRARCDSHTRRDVAAPMWTDTVATNRVLGAGAVSLSWRRRRDPPDGRRPEGSGRRPMVSSNGGNLPPLTVTSTGS